MRYLHTMVRVSNLDESLKFFALLGLSEVRRTDSDKGRFTNVHLAARDDLDLAKSVRAPTVELTYNWDPEDYMRAGAISAISPSRSTTSTRLCRSSWRPASPSTVPPRDGHMAFIRTPDNISIELLQKGDLAPQEPWASMPNTGSW